MYWTISKFLATLFFYSKTLISLLFLFSTRTGIKTIPLAVRQEVTQASEIVNACFFMKRYKSPVFLNLIFRRMYLGSRRGSFSRMVPWCGRRGFVLFRQIKWFQTTIVRAGSDIICEEVGGEWKKIHTHTHTLVAYLRGGGPQIVSSVSSSHAATQKDDLISTLTLNLHPQQACSSLC